MKPLVLFLALCGLAACESKEVSQPISNDQATVEILEVPDNEIGLDQLALHRIEGVWKLGGENYSGFAFKYFENGQLHKKIGFANGKKEGIATEYFSDGHPRQVSHFHENKFHGTVQNWSGSEGHPKLAVRNYWLGKPHGTHTKWYTNGQVFKIMHYKMGKEEGMQQAFNDNGSLYANYEAKNGRIFGLKRSMPCYQLDDEIIQFYDGE